jgi:hypothetical protein
MNKAPSIGDRVKVNSWHPYHPCTGIVTAIWPTRHYDVAHPRWNDPDYDPPDLGLEHEREWKVTVKVDAIPRNWDYFDSDLFQPAVHELELA